MADTVASFPLPSRPLDLSAGLREDSQGAFEEIFRAYHQPVYNFVFRLLEDPSDAPDVTQEVFLKVFRGLRDFRGECCLKTWVYRIAIHEASNLRRWFWRHRRGELSLDGNEDGGNGLGNTLASSEETPYEWTLRQERIRAVEAALSQVQGNFRAAVVLRDIEGLSYEEIAEVLEISVGTVKSRILRGREALRQKLPALLAEPAAASCVLQTAE